MGFQMPRDGALTRSGKDEKDLSSEEEEGEGWSVRCSLN